MKKKYFGMFALAAMVLSACSNDDIGSSGNSDIVTDPTGEAWVALKVITPSTPVMRALNNPDFENGTEPESEIKTVRAIFFTKDADPVVTADIELTNDEAGLSSTGQPTGTAGTAFKIPATSKRILLVANPSAKFPDKITTVSKAYSVINAEIAEEAGLISSTNGFMMTNAKGHLEPSLSNGDDTDLVLYKTSQAATTSPLSVNIDRVVAKVRVAINANTESSATINLDNGGWLLNVTNKKYFPVSERLTTWYETNGGGFRAPFDQYRKGAYRKDPNFASHNVGTDYTYVAADPGDGNWLASGTSKYCLENTQDAASNMHAYTTHVLFKAKFIPNEYKMPGTATASTDQDEKGDWMLINGGYYTFTTLMSWIEAELTYKFNQPEPLLISTALTSAFNKYLGTEGIGIGEVVLPDDKAGIPATMNDFRNKKAAILGKSDTERAKTVGSLTYYAGAVCYYKAIIKHDDTDAAVNELGEFRVVRNSVYDIVVSKFNNPGYPIIPDPGTDEPDEEDEKWLSIQINVNPWTWYKQVEEF